MATVWSLLVSIFGGIIQISMKVMEMMKEKELVNRGIELERNRQRERDSIQAKAELETSREQSEVLLTDLDKKDVINKMENGKF